MTFAQASFTKRSGLLFAATLLAASAATAAGIHGGGHDESPIGEAGVAGKVSRTIQVDAADSMRFTPSLVAVKKGETIRFVVTNSGKVPHEFGLGTEKELKEHYEVMKKNPGMEHEEANKISLKPGKTGEVIWRFTKGGVVDFACLHPGHYEAGMKGQISVTNKSASAVSPSLAPAGSVPAQMTMVQDKSGMDQGKMGTAATPGLTDGEIRKIDKEGGKITIKHGEIKHLDMPAMTMVFTAKDKAMLDKVQVGEKIQFIVIQEAGKMVVTDIQSRK